MAADNRPTHRISRNKLMTVAGTGLLISTAVLGFTTLAAADESPRETAPVSEDRPAESPAQGQEQDQAQAGPTEDHGPAHTVDSRPAADMKGAYQLNPSTPQIKTVKAWLAAPNTPQDTGYQEYSVGSARGEMAALLSEYEREGWTQEGTPKVVGKTMAAPLSIDGAEGARVSVCLNESSVRVKGEKGRIVRPEQQGRRIMRSFDMVKDGTEWHMVATGFPAQPRC